MTSHPAQQPTQPPKTQGTQRAQRIEANASIIWPGQGRSFEIEFETDDNIYWSCVLQELCGDPFNGLSLVPRTMTGYYGSTERAVQALDKELEDWAAAAKLAKERQRALKG
jgi:hypothetical protein